MANHPLTNQHLIPRHYYFIVAFQTVAGTVTHMSTVNFPPVPHENIEDYTEEQLLTLAQDPKTDPSILDYLATHACLDIRWEIASNPSTSPQSFRSLDSDHFSVKIALAENTSTPDEVLHTLIYDTAPEVSYEASRNPNVSVATLTKVASNLNPDIKTQVLKNRNVTSNILKQLAQDSQEIVRERTADSLYASKEVLAMLADDTSMFVRWSVASNLATSTATLKKLANDPQIDIRESVGHQRETRLEEYIRQLPSDVVDVAKLLLPSFTGWPDDLETVLMNLNVSQKRSQNAYTSNKIML